MATFQVQIEGLTGLSIGTSPTTGEVTQFLKDGLSEVINRIITLNPYETSKFTATSNSHSHITKTGKILSVMREHASTTILRRCDQIHALDRYDATDESSLHYRSAHNPGWYELDGNIHIVPVASASGDNDIIVTQVYYDTGIAFGDSVPDNFPNEYVYLVTLYAAVKSLHSALAAKDNDLPSDLTNIVLGTISTSLPTYSGPTSFVMPVPPAGVDVDFSEVGSIVTFISPVFSAPDLGTISAMSLPNVPVSPSIDSVSVSITGTAPTYTQPIISIDNLDLNIAVPIAPALTSTTVVESGLTSPEFVAPIMSNLDFADTNTWISTEEDSEMLEARVAEINAKITDHQAKLQESIAQFNKENVVFQKNIQVALTNAQFGNEEDNQKLAKYGQEVQSYSAQVNNELAEYQTEFSLKLQKYGADIQNNLNVFNKENTEYQAKLQKDLTDAQLSESKEGRELQAYSIKLQSYGDEVNKEIQRWTGEVFNKEFNEWSQKYQGQLQEYGNDIQKESARISSSMNDYQAKVQKALGEYQAETGYDLGVYQNQVQTHIAKFQSDLAENSSDFTNNLQKYSAEIQKVSSDNQSVIADFQSKIQDYSAKLQKLQLNYGWMQARMMKLQQEYDTAFQIISPQQQQGEQ